MFKLDDLKIRRRSWVKTAGVPKARIGWTLDDCKDTQEDVIKKIRTWQSAVERGQIIQAESNKNCGKGLLLCGDPGRGKTTLALATIQEMMTVLPLSAFNPPESGVIVRPCYFITFNDFLELKGAMIDGPTAEQETLFYGILGECLDDSYNIRILVVDDVGKEHASLTGWQKNMLHHLLRTRFNRGLPTIVTTNILLDNWAALYGDATESFAREAFAYLPVLTNKGDLRK